MNIRVSREQFESYVEVQKSGVTNMFAVDIVSLNMKVAITKDEIFYIMENYGELEKRFKPKSFGGE